MRDKKIPQQKSGRFLRKRPLFCQEDGIVLRLALGNSRLQRVTDFNGILYASVHPYLILRIVIAIGNLYTRLILQIEYPQAFDRIAVNLQFFPGEAVCIACLLYTSRCV